MTDACLWLGPPWLGLGFSVALTVCWSWALFFVSAWCVNLIGVFFHDDTLRWLDGLRAGWASLVLQQQQNLGRRFGASGVHLGPLVAWAAVRSEAVVLLLLTFCLLLLPLFESVIVQCFVVC